MKHTEWTVSDGGTRVLQGTETIADCAITGQGQASWATAKERAAFIVTACNAHEELVEALDECLTMLCDMTSEDFARGGDASMRTKIRAALTKVKGE